MPLKRLDSQKRYCFIRGDRRTSFFCNSRRAADRLDYRYLFFKDERRASFGRFAGTPVVAEVFTRKSVFLQDLKKSCGFSGHSRPRRKSKLFPRDPL